MLKHTIDFPLIGQLTMQGQRKIWEGRWGIPELGQDDFNVIIYGELNGPTAAQQNVLQNFYQNRNEMSGRICDELAAI
ncbi:hypothetical protein [Eikenella sp. Marseille-P7795]|uniref:hypothetical protein n=1 Tax=Eikenella sp. Marseille-P7795 TaxID=2866577 RepID=UPI001CE4444C|nr:hypothetical protein [Eikenella sp. Marseille-P7795]